jgi:poly-gamma-glutamate capsule biosynthesis protein CapA/YwtB (metallophosphatase superfamily)
MGLSLLVLAQADAGQKREARRPSTLDQCDTLFELAARPWGHSIQLSWYDMPGVTEWAVYRSTNIDMRDMQVAALVRGACTWVESDSFIVNHPIAFYRVAARWDAGNPSNYTVIEDFETPVTLESYSTAEDRDPNNWQWHQDGAYDSTGWCLEIMGNTWKRERIDTVEIGHPTVWRIAVKTVAVGEVQGFGIGDSANDLWYTIWGTQVQYSESWNTTYQGFFPRNQWVLVDLPVGDDFFGRYGYYPRISSLLFANDNDALHSAGIFRIDDIRDVTGTISLSPNARFHWSIAGYPTPDTMEVAFCSMGCDPDGPLFREFWSFGDGTTGYGTTPIHRYAARGRYTVTLTVQDTSNRVDWVVHQIADTIGVASGQITALFAGDVMMGRRYEDWLIPTYGVDSIFGRIRPLVSSVDMAVCNLETPLTNSTTHHPTKQFYFKGRPEYVEGLRFAGIDVVTLANNHSMDYMLDGMHDTKHVLDSVAMLSTGTGDNDEVARQPAFFSLNGLCVAVLSFCNRDGSPDNEQPFMAAAPSKPGFAMWDRSNAELMIPAARQVADIVIVETHSGIEYAVIPTYLAAQGFSNTDDQVAMLELLPDTTDVQLRRYAIDLGADMVINHHPHVIEGCEVYHGKLIAHSMGNFAFDQQFPETMPSMAITTTLGRTVPVSTPVMHPVYIDRYMPGQARGALAGAILDYESELSRPMGSWVVRQPFADSALILLDTTGVQRTGEDHRDTLALETVGGSAESAPHLLQGGGYPVSAGVVTLPGAQYRLGHEILWSGNLEPEGSTPWDLNSNYEHYDTATVHSGHQSIRLNRTGGGGNSVSTTFVYRPPFDNSVHYSMVGWMTGTNTRETRMIFEYWNYRTGGSRLDSVMIGGEHAGSFPWTFGWADLPSVDNTGFYSLKLNLRSPTTGEGFAWFDDMAIVRWDDWQTAPGPIGFPSDITYIQVKAPIGTATAVITYRREWVGEPPVMPPQTTVSRESSFGR